MKASSLFHGYKTGIMTIEIDFGEVFATKYLILLCKRYASTGEEWLQDGFLRW